MRDPAKYTPRVLRYIEKFNQAIEHFRDTGHRWPTSRIHSTKLTAIREIHSVEAFQNWILYTQNEYDFSGEFIQAT